jgi:hypothetical protein
MGDWIFDQIVQDGADVIVHGSKNRMRFLRVLSRNAATLFYLSVKLSLLMLALGFRNHPKADRLQPDQGSVTCHFADFELQKSIKLASRVEN